MDRLRCIEVFIEVARGRSFSAAAERLGMSKGSVTKYVAWLEQLLGAQLLTRTTKNVSPTEAGLSLLENGQDFLDRFEQIEVTVRRSVKSPKGVLRVGTPPYFGAFHLIPLIAEFSAVHPDIHISLYLDDGRADLVNEGLDLSVRIAPSLKDTSQVAQKLANVPQLLVASPSYLKTEGTPKTLADLSRHNCLVNALKSPINSWTFFGPEGRASVRVSGTIRANFGEALRQAALLGQGISMHPTYMVDQDIKEKRLKIVLPAYRPTELDIYIVFPSRINMPARVRIFLEFLKKRFEATSGFPASGAASD